MYGVDLWLGKHPVSALVEHCLKCKWQPPQFQVVHDSGPDHKKSYLMKVVVNNKEYRASHTAPTKKLAKATAAAACLVALGLVSDQPMSPQGNTVVCSSSVQQVPSMPLTVGSAASQEAFPPPGPLPSLTLHGMNITHHQFPQQQQMTGGGSISYSVGASSGGIQPLMSINACDYAGRNGNVNIIIGPQIPTSHSAFSFGLQDGHKGKVPLLPAPPRPLAAAATEAFPAPGVLLDSFPPPLPSARGPLLPSPAPVQLSEAGPKPLIIKTENQ
ncbi:Double-stranded RNA-binding domain [Trinorchestia longiramus]|nr:Double-stranded RNA-binding domain [Trinorchestia longiramus]